MIRTVEIESIQPSALYLNQKDVGEWLMKGVNEDGLTEKPFPAIIADKQIILIDDHPRAFLASQTAIRYIQIDIHKEVENAGGYGEMAEKCRENGVTKLTDLTKQLLSPKDYQRGRQSEIPAFFSGS
ncbi:hypothetical protein [Salisediminibacterium halotolerans]|uniref:hypothetical protein n=1 Tax=Salisediminibacterium halotolerans TaxID=517425 RepID=UPI000EAD5A72|nr:hypothetical protein [Salisediminibacterium halotolerans]RLJ74062.1 hypothetical protein BCL39_1346 [Actinophytocola xinjiangensis]RPE87845.1 hypothetical protein EDD67_1585 [Salisediminibacterium halotolerans]TWG34899.1 hypothetical protein BCL52_1343 [Salisediminibacterium halotolerans]GEL07913.1 hypothetical protein SHA02_13290 [Salisediminibacterium halotolerans]